MSYKNHKVVKKDESEWTVTENNHEPIISQELRDKVREVDESVSQGKSTKEGVVLPLSGLCYCADCGAKMKKNGTHNCQFSPSYTCSRYSKYGKQYCSSHSIRTDAAEQMSIVFMLPPLFSVRCFPINIIALSAAKCSTLRGLCFGTASGIFAASQKLKTC